VHFEKYCTTREKHKLPAMLRIMWQYKNKPRCKKKVGNTGIERRLGHRILEKGMKNETRRQQPA